MSQPIPVRNIWLLFLYAADLVQFKGITEGVAEDARDLPEMIARVLTRVVRQRLQRNLNRGYQPRQEVLSRVRGRIDVLTTFSNQLLEQGRVACRFEEHTQNTPRNRLVRAALDNLAVRVNDSDVAHECRALSKILGQMGVVSQQPTHSTLKADQITRNETADLLMVSLARMVFDVLIPSTEKGGLATPGLSSDSQFVRLLFEKAVANALRIQLQPLGWWRVKAGRKLKWPVTAVSGESVLSLLPGMQTDIELYHPVERRKLVIDTKFTQIFTRSQYKDELIKSGYLYQLYSYLRSQEDELSVLGIQHSEGMLLHPQFGRAVDEFVDIQGHRIRFKTIDLMSSAEEFEKQLLCLVM